MQDLEISRFIKIIKNKLYSDYRGMYKEAGGALPFPFITPGSQQYSDVLWDWDSWLSNVALRQILLELGDKGEEEYAEKYEKGCVLNFLTWGGKDG
ncbi:MAG TPA: glycoside hydrolase family 37, partial [Spirochaetia bacterium]|nr:glycoside hydrolase family 37 [Spirochaetia bacterium]